MQPRLLSTFLAVARLGNVTHAATELGLAQSSVSDQLQLLEGEVGASLFERSRQGVALTAAGETLKAYAEELLDLTREARTAIAATRGAAPNSLTVGALETLAAHRVAPWLAEFGTSGIAADLRLTVGGTGQLLSGLMNGTIDVAFCFGTGATDERLVSRRIAAEPLVLIAAADGTALDARDLTDLADLADRSFVVTEAGCAYRRLLDEAFVASALRSPRIAAEVGSIGALVRMVAMGVGIGLVPRLAAIEAIERGEVVECPWPGSDGTAPLTMIWRRRRVQPVGLRRFLDAMSDRPHLVRRDGVRPRRAEPYRS